MADQYESGTNWTIERLRTTDASYLRGATRAVGAFPDPIAVARGGVSTNAGALTASAVWVVDTTIPAADDICWVVVQDNLQLQMSQVSGDTTPVNVYWWPQGNNALATALTPPAMGPGVINDKSLIASAGTYRWAAVPAVPTPRTTWVPLDPSNTISGVATSCSILANAVTPPAAGEWRLNMTGCTMLGYPVNSWGTGELWHPMSQRGS